MLRCQLKLHTRTRRGVKGAWAGAAPQPKLALCLLGDIIPCGQHWANKPSAGPGGQQGRESQAGVTAMLLELGACCAPPGCLSQVFPGISILPFPAPCRIHGLQTAVEGQTTAGAKGTPPSAQVATWCHLQETRAGIPAISDLPLTAGFA